MTSLRSRYRRRCPKTPGEGGEVAELRRINDVAMLTGLEPATSALTGRCANQLRHSTKMLRYHILTMHPRPAVKPKPYQLGDESEPEGSIRMDLNHEVTAVTSHRVSREDVMTDMPETQSADGNMRRFGPLSHVTDQPVTTGFEPAISRSRGEVTVRPAHRTRQSSLVRVTTGETRTARGND